MSTQPKYILPDFELRSGHYVVESEGMYAYYPIKVSTDQASGFFKVTKRPPLLLDGVIILDRKAYVVTTMDIQRGIVRKSSLILSGRANDSTHSNESTNAPRTGSAALVPRADQHQPRNSNEPSISGELGMEIAEAADLAWNRQASSLLQAIHSQEGGEWEIADAV
ncbi:MAG TPA: hypothetical protein VFM18_08700 [Methanosarcina sp.]|nr:hypothetical protein [Methanosarcina sp.]